MPGNSIDVKGAVMLADWVKRNTMLKTLDLARGVSVLLVNAIFIIVAGNYIQDDGACALAEALKTNHTLSSLNLSRTRCDDCCQNCFNITAENGIHSRGARALAEALASRPPIMEELDVECSDVPMVKHKRCVTCDRQPLGA